MLTKLRRSAAAKGADSLARARELLVETLSEVMMTDSQRALAQASKAPTVILLVGVNGSGKTTTVAKLAYSLNKDGHTVVLAAADTFRAAAVSQLQTWGSRLGVSVVSGPDNADPAAVAFDALRQAEEARADYVLIDTAGRLHTSSALMDELAKVRRVVEKRHPVDECLLVLDATTGQNGINQAKAFVTAVGATGIVLTKLDGSARGGVVIAVEESLGLPVKFVGTGEDMADLAPFDREEFIEALVTNS